MNKPPSRSGDYVPPKLPIEKLSEDHPLRDCREELEALYEMIHCRYQDESELSDRKVVIGHLKRLMVAMCAPTLRERFDKNEVWLNPQTDKFMDEVRLLFEA